MVAFTPKGGCPLKLDMQPYPAGPISVGVAFTPKGGCPLKPRKVVFEDLLQGVVAFTPKGGCPLKLNKLRASCELQKLA